MVAVGPVPGDGGDEFAAAGQFRGKLVLSDLLQVVADCCVGWCPIALRLIDRGEDVM